MKGDILVLGGRIVSGSSEEVADILIRNGKVVSLGTNLSREGVSNIIQADDKLVLPGAIDAHCHPVYSDKMDDYSITAALGGITTVIPFIGNVGAWGYTGETSEIVKNFIEDSMRISYIDFSVHAVFTAGDSPVDSIPVLADMGVISYKMFMAYAKRGMMMPDDMMLEIMDITSSVGGLAMVHAENGHHIDHMINKLTAEGKTEAKYFLPSQPNIAEAEAVYRALTYAEIKACPIYIVHLSAKESLPIVMNKKFAGQTIYGETCPHYLTLTNDELLTKGYIAKVAPPLREQDDVDALWEAIDNCTIDVIGSDSTGLTMLQKESGGLDSDLSSLEITDKRASGNIFGARYGLNTIQHMVPVIFSEITRNSRISFQRLVKLFCENPAKIFGLYPTKGVLQEGSDADLVLWDPKQKWTVESSSLGGNGDFTTFEGFELLGLPVLTMQRGNVVMRSGEVVGRQGDARFIPGNVNSTPYASQGYSI